MAPVGRDLPAGTVTFLFTDVEGSTRLLQELGDGYADALTEHRRVLREAFAAHGGAEVDTQGDAFFVAFARAKDALGAAADAQRALAGGPVRVRIGVHTGEPLVTDEGYVGIDVHRAARIAAAGHGGQVLVSQSTRDLVGAEALRDLGEHRLKDLTAPERIFQLGDGDFAPLVSLNQTNLPVQPTPLIGRGEELRAVLGLMGSSRLLTLTGAGGSGKTRLALQAAAEVVTEFADGVWFVSLAAVNEVDLVVPTIASTVGAKGELLEFLGPKRLLLVLDNVEQLLPDAAPQIAGLLAAPNVRVLATSRERLAVTAEQEYPVPTLELEEGEALFTVRARQLKPSFEADQHVTEIVRRLDGLPLALELAAARVKVLLPSQIVDRLGHSLDLLTSGARDAPGRQRTLRATIEWSYELLTEDERRLFARVAAFAGSFDLGAAEAVCGAELDTLASLVDKSLLRQASEGRFFMLETIREYADERLREADDASEVLRRHAAHYLAVAESVRSRVPPGDLGPADAECVTEHDNMRTALTFFESVRDVERELELVRALGWFWMQYGHHAEGRWRTESALRRGTGAPTALYLEVLTLASSFAYMVGDLQVATSYAEQGLVFAREIGEPLALVRALLTLGNTAVGQGDYSRGKDLYGQAISAASEPGGLVAGSIANLGDIALIEGDYEEAIARSAEALELLRQAGWKHGMLIAQGNLAFAFFHVGRIDEARQLVKEGLTAAHYFGHRALTSDFLIAAAALAANAQRRDEAGRLLGAAETILDELGLRLHPASRRLHDAATAAVGAARTAALREEGMQLQPDAAVALALRSLE
jgi:predicted ATPase/class 3 adenylate cyclase